MSEPTLPLNDGSTIPQLGLGVWRTPEEQAAEVVQCALAAGYRHVDTAAIYGNEAGVGRGVRASGLPRESVFVTTKVWNEDQGHDAALRAIERSLQRLDMDHVDLCLIHWPSPQRGLYVDTWRALIRAREQGLARAIGVSNFAPEHLERIVGETGVKPVLNQVELHPRFQQRQLREAHARLGIATESWSPLGQGQLLDDPRIAQIATRHGKTAAQVIIRWHLQHGLVVIPKSVTPSRIRDNHAVADFTLDAQDMAVLDGMDAADGRIGPNPLTAAF